MRLSRRSSREILIARSGCTWRCCRYRQKPHFRVPMDSTASSPGRRTWFWSSAGAHLGLAHLPKWLDGRGWLEAFTQPGGVNSCRSQSPRKRLREFAARHAKTDHWRAQRRSSAGRPNTASSSRHSLTAVRERVPGLKTEHRPRCDEPPDCRANKNLHRLAAGPGSPLVPPASVPRCGGAPRTFPGRDGHQPRGIQRTTVLE